LQVTQTAGLALATDLAAERTRPRVVALMYVMLLLGMAGGALLYGLLLQDYTHTRLVQVVQGTAVACVLLNLAAVWKQEPRDSLRAQHPPPREPFAVHWQRFAAGGRVRRFLVTVGLGALAFNMQDVILEPYGGEILGLGVSATTQLTGLMAGGALLAFALAARALGRGADPHRVAAAGLVAGVVAFSAVVFAEPLQAPLLFRAGGDDSVRGYAYRSLGPELNGAVVSGSTLFTTSVQLARPIFADQPAFLWALFVDAGNASPGWNNMRPEVGYGAGLHWRSPVGPLRVDLAYGQEVRKFRLHFSVGVVF
jgi:hypothetical protein